VKRSESTAAKLLRRNLPRPEDRVNFVEGNISGMPDVNYCMDGVEGWIELKAPPLPKRDRTALMSYGHKLKPMQIRWIKRQLRAGGRVFILLCTEEGWILLNGKFAGIVNELTFDEMVERSEWIAPKKMTETDWDLLRDVLVR
jgi:hypothetical protein